MIVKSQLNTQSNQVVRHITGVSVEEKENTDIIGIQFDCCKPIWIDTARNVYSRSKNTLLKRNECNTQNGRHTVTLSLPECENNTRIALYKLACIAKELAKDIIRDDYCGLHCNHKDRTGNKDIYGYCNNRLYNLELVSSTADEIHWHCIERLQKVVGKHFSISADNTEIINKCRMLSDEKLKEQAEQWLASAEYDSQYDTYIIK